MNDVFTLPYLCLRALVLFPGSEVDLAVGRTESKKVIAAAREQYGNKLVVVTQRRAEQGVEVLPDDLYRIGTICHFDALVRLADLEKVHVTAERRATLFDFRVKQGTQLVNLRPFEEEEVPDDYLTTEHVALRESIAKIAKDAVWTKDALNFITAARAPSDVVRACLAYIREEEKRKIGLSLQKRTEFPEDDESARRVNRIIAEEQRVLEAPSALEQLQLIGELMARLRMVAPDS